MRHKNGFKHLFLCLNFPLPQFLEPVSGASDSSVIRYVQLHLSLWYKLCAAEKHPNVVRLSQGECDWCIMNPPIRTAKPRMLRAPITGLILLVEILSLLTAHPSPPRMPRTKTTFWRDVPRRNLITVLYIYQVSLMCHLCVTHTEWSVTRA